MNSKNEISEVAAHKHIVLCGDNLNAISILRNLGEIGIKPIVILIQEGNLQLVKYCRYVGKLISTNSFGESLTNCYRLVMS